MEIKNQLKKNRYASIII